jgi:hypothetical protein
MIIEHQDPALMKIVVWSEAVLATYKESITFAIVIHLQFIRRPAAGRLPEYNLPKLHS